MNELEQLLERVKSAKYPDRELDRDIASHFGDYVKCETGNRSWRSAPSRSGPWRSLPNYTGSLDASLDLMAKLLPDQICRIYMLPSGTAVAIEKNERGGQVAYWGESTSPPSAILSALLSALIDLEALK